MTTVVVVQALVFADGGIVALGLNVFNIAIITVLTGWVVFRGLIRLLPSSATSVVAATAVASWMSVVVSSTAFAGQYALGGGGEVAASTVLGAMAGVHAIIGVGEGLIAAGLIAAVLASRPDLVRGARLAGVTHGDRVEFGRRPVLAFAATGFAIAIALFVIAAPHASESPDGLERVVEDHGIAVAE